MKQTGKRINHDPVSVIALSQLERLSQPPMTPNSLFLWVSGVFQHSFWLSFFPQWIFRWTMLEFITVIRICVKDHFPSETQILLPNLRKKKDITSFNKPNKPTKEKGTDVSVLMAHVEEQLLLGQVTWPPFGESDFRAWPSNIATCPYPGVLQRDPNLHWIRYLFFTVLLWKIPFETRFIFSVRKRNLLIYVIICGYYTVLQ